MIKQDAQDMKRLTTSSLRECDVIPYKSVHSRWAWLHTGTDEMLRSVCYKASECYKHPLVIHVKYFG